MDNILQEYKDYYRARYERIAGNPRYPNSIASEKKLYDAMASCNELEEFKDKIGNLNELNAVALVLDQETIRNEEYTNLKEDVRALGPQRIVKRCESATTVQEVITITLEESNKNSIEISMDEAVREFNDWIHLENIEIYSKAQVPDRWKADHASNVEASKNRLKDIFDDLEKNNNPWQEGWKIDFDLIWEERHRRLLPFSDGTIKKRLEETKAITGR
jgi:hypothetical protein